VISPLIGRGIGFGGVRFIPKLGFGPAVVPAPPEPIHRIFRMDQSGAGGDLFRVNQSGAGADLFRSAQPGTGSKLFG
jgi:hypothetical protein